jgi:hypothetical protein
MGVKFLLLFCLGQNFELVPFNSLCDACALYYAKVTNFNFTVMLAQGQNVWLELFIR